MGATSVTGVGLGSADKKQKGSEHLSIGVEKLIGPRAVAVGQVTLSGGGSATVILPALDGASTDYFVLANDQNTSSAAAVGAALAISAGVSTTLTFKGTAAHVISYAVFKAGLAI